MDGSLQNPVSLQTIVKTPGRECQAITAGGETLEATVRRAFETSWGTARRWIATGKVTVEGEVVTDGVRRLRAGLRVELHMAAPRPGPTTPAGRGGSAAELPRDALLYVDAHLVVVEKPPGISTIPYLGAPPEAGGTGPHEATLDSLVRDALSREARRQGQSARTPPALGVVHRIDKETSGLVVFTRTWLAKQALSAQFRAHTVQRRYLALVHGRATSRTYESHLVLDRGDGLRGSLEARKARGARVDKGAAGVRAVTHVEVLEHLPGPTPATLVACRLETGKTHQIRIHLSEGGHPLLGERVYIRGFSGVAVPAPRLMLHAAELGFVHPKTEAEVAWTSPLPEDIQATLARLRC